MPLNLPDPQLPGNPQDALQSIQRNFEALATRVNPGNFGAFAPYTPTLTAATTNPTLGTGSTRWGNYAQIGKVVVAHFGIVFGSGGSAGTGNYAISAPVKASNSMDQGLDLYFGIAKVGNNGVRSGVFRFNSSTTHFQIIYEADAGGLGVVDESSPGAWGTSGQEIWGQIIYEAA